VALPAQHPLTGRLSRWCGCSGDVYLCSLHSVHANLRINMQLYTLRW
jgi:hypothetical protein